MSKDKVKITSRQILLYLVDGLVSVYEPFDRHGFYRKNIQDYYHWRDMDKKRFSDNIKRLEREGFIKIFLDHNNQNIIELCGKGKEKVGLMLAKDYEYQMPTKWDGKWRIVIFDISDEKKKNRDILRQKLLEIGFIQLQESVFVFPFDCKTLIDFYKSLFMIEPDVQYIIAEAIETQIDLLDVFLSQGILKRNMLQK